MSTGPTSAWSAWGALLVLTGLGTALSTDLVALPVPVTGLLILGLALAKARIILLFYLGLKDAPHWRGGGVAALTLCVLLLAGLFLAA
jgi:hypothetical protein